jgi:hypothetical protein
VSPRRPERSRPQGTSALVPRVEPLAVGSFPAAAVSPVTGAAPEPAPEPAGKPAPPAAPDPGSATDTVPKYLRLVRHDLRVRAQQMEALAALRRRISADRGRKERSERITDNTLIRVAIDLLLEHGDELAGSTEDQIRDSALRAAPPKHRT